MCDFFLQLQLFSTWECRKHESHGMHDNYMWAEGTAGITMRLGL